MNTEYMIQALKLAEKGRGWVNPNPMVGAVIVKNGKVIGRGFHEKYGELHAERNALADCSESPEGAEMYVTLEPCCHFGKTPPCTDAILESRIKKVVIGSRDPNPIVNGKGIEILRKHGVEVLQGTLEEECDRLNEVFFHYTREKKPFVIMKYAMTLDGKIAAKNGESKWITGKEARAHVHRSRHNYSAIMIGIGTVIKDDPMLNCRAFPGKDPVRVICDTNLSIPIESKIVRSAGEIPTFIAAAEGINSEKKAELEKQGCCVLKMKTQNGRVDLQHLMELLGELKIDSLYLEGGSELHYSALSQNIVDKVHAYIAPKILGGRQAKSPVGGEGWDSPDRCFGLKTDSCRITPLGDDLLLEYDVRRDGDCSPE